MIRAMPAAVVLVLALATSAAASTLCAKVLDPADLPIPGRVTVWGLSEDVYREQSAGKTGVVCFDDLPEGAYAVEANALPSFMAVRKYPVRASDKPTEVVFRLPFAEPPPVFDDPPRESIVSGTLRRGGIRVRQAAICLMRIGRDSDPYCTESDSFGEYLLIVPPAKYRAEILIEFGGKVYRSELDASKPGFHRNHLTLPSAE